MKTEQEQIEEMIKILLEASEKCLDTDCNYCDYQYKKDCAQYRKAVTLVKAGYGDVSEYKAEIERLKAENDTNMQYIRMMGIQNHIKTSNERVKQAKIDVLNELKKRSYTDNDFMDGKWHRYVLTNDIDEMIEDVKRNDD